MPREATSDAPNDESRDMIFQHHGNERPEAYLVHKNDGREVERILLVESVVMTTICEDDAFNRQIACDLTADGFVDVIGLEAFSPMMLEDHVAALGIEGIGKGLARQLLPVQVLKVGVGDDVSVLRGFGRRAKHLKRVTGHDDYSDG